MRQAAQYLRMSTEHQRYSLEHQAAAIAIYAATKGFEIVRTYQDVGRSGLRLKQRDALRELLADVLSGQAAFDTVLVLDVSRWGRFQDTDESAHYEYICRAAGVQIWYCAEVFENDGSMASTIVKNLKRAMAAEYSRELSVKVSRARTAMFRRGFWQGGSAGFGLRRQIVNLDGAPGPQLETGEFKAIQGQRCILAPGPMNEIAVVRRIYRMFTVDRLKRATIARILKAEGVLGEGGKPWSRRMVHGVLSNPKYVGDLVGNRTSTYLQSRPVRRHPSEWVRTPRAFEPIISRKVFAAAQERIQETSVVHMNRTEMVEVLRSIYDRHGKITRELIGKTPGLPWAGIFYRDIGGPTALYTAIGVKPPRPPRRPRLVLSDDEILRRLSALLARVGHLSKDLINADPDLPTMTTVGDRFCGLTEAYRRIGYKQTSHRERHTAAAKAKVEAAFEAMNSPTDPCL